MLDFSLTTSSLTLGLIGRKIEGKGKRGKKLRKNIHLFGWREIERRQGNIGALFSIGATIFCPPKLIGRK